MHRSIAKMSKFAFEIVMRFKRRISLFAAIANGSVKCSIFCGKTAAALRCNKPFGNGNKSKIKTMRWCITSKQFQQNNGRGLMHQFAVYFPYYFQKQFHIDCLNWRRKQKPSLSPKSVCIHKYV